MTASGEVGSFGAVTAVAVSYDFVNRTDGRLTLTVFQPPKSPRQRTDCARQCVLHLSVIEPKYIIILKNVKMGKNPSSHDSPFSF